VSHASASSASPRTPTQQADPHGGAVPARGGTDVLSRAVSYAIQNNTKWTIVVDNKPGAGGNIGLDFAAKAAPDGYTIAMGQTANLAVNPALYSKMPYDPLKDFAPVALVSSQPLILVVSATRLTRR
jgi:tripartite-type tricarboxylate transporter receptor subunit TctC